MLVDDYLDLYNYAKAINDEQWQADIIERLNHWIEVTEACPVQEESVTELWARFDALNIMIKKLFHKLQENEDSEQQFQWKEQLWELKLERSMLSKKILNRYIRIR